MKLPSEMDPAIRELLEEIAADPSSALFRVPTGPVKLQREDVARSPSTLWSRAERHLLDVHRAEVAHLLFDACQLRLLADATASAHLCTRLRKGLDNQGPDQALFGRRLLDETHCPEFDPTLADCNLLAQCMGGGPSPSAVDLASASLRLVPCDAARISLGSALHFERNDLPSKQYLLSQVLVARSAPLLRCSAWQNLGLTQVVQGRWEDALESFAAACSTIEGAGLSAANWFWVALRLGHSEIAIEAARLLEAIDDPPSVDAFLAWYRRTQAPAADDRPPATRVRVPQWIESLPNHARRIAHAVA